MAGHSKFKNIMHRKGAQDKKRSKVFTRIIREISIAANLGLPDPNMNARLRSAIDAAKDANIPKDKVENAIKKATDSSIKDDYEDMRYEGYGPGGVAIIVEASTNNKNRTAGEVRSVFVKYNGTLGENGSVSYMFSRKGIITYNKSTTTFDKILEIALEADAEDCTVYNDEEDDSYSEYEITCEVEKFTKVKNFLAQKLKSAKNAEITWIPNNTVELNQENIEKIMKLIEALENIDDVDNVIANFVSI